MMYVGYAGTGGTEEGPAQEVLDMVQADNMNFLREKLTAFITGAQALYSYIYTVHVARRVCTVQTAVFRIRMDLN
jgi:hypothetical protein